MIYNVSNAPISLLFKETVFILPTLGDNYFIKLNAKYNQVEDWQGVPILERAVSVDINLPYDDLTEEDKLVISEETALLINSFKIRLPVPVYYVTKEYCVRNKRGMIEYYTHLCRLA